MHQPLPSANPAATSSNAFALDLFTILRTNPGNLFYSPYSIATALAMTWEGAAGPTAAEMQNTLHLDPHPARNRPAFTALIQRLQSNPEETGVSLITANRLWPQSNYPIKPEYLTITRDAYFAGIQSLDYANPAACRQTINAWVAEQTRLRIQYLIGPRDLTPATRLVLTNAIYFKAPWTDPFNEAATTVGDFSTPDQKVPAKFMHKSAHLDYAAFPETAATPAFQAIDLPYADEDLSMLILLPAPGNLPLLEAALSPTFLSSVISALTSPKVQLTLPRFRIEQSFHLRDALESLGIQIAFTDAADFSNITPHPQGLAISEVIHKAFVDLNEAGTEAAAATAVIMLAGSTFRPEPPIPFTADHPFLFLIRDRATQTILFLGRLTDPT